MFCRPLGWQWACQVQLVTMLGLSQQHTWWLAEGSHGLVFPNGSAAQSEPMDDPCSWITLAGCFSIPTPVLCPSTSLNGSCCHGHTAWSLSVVLAGVAHAFCRTR